MDYILKKARSTKSKALQKNISIRVSMCSMRNIRTDRVLEQSIYYYLSTYMFKCKLESKARVVYLIQYGRECCKFFVKLSNFIDLFAK